MKILRVAALGIVATTFMIGGELAHPSVAAESDAPAPRGLVALYDFSDASGPVVRDQSSVGEALDLRIIDMKSVRRAEGSLEVHGKTVIRSDKPAKKIIDAVRRSGEITLEAWVRPAKTEQTGPARIVSLSKNTSERNFTLGQEGEQFDVRLRTTKSSTNGIPSVSSAGKSLKTGLTHVVYTRDGKGRARVYVNGRNSGEGSVAGDMTNWDGSHQLALANELSGDRPWQGTYYLVAIYSRSFSTKEVEENFKAGSGGEAVRELLAAARLAQGEELFNKGVAPLLVRKCFECHDSTTHKGDLDLSRKTTALAGGESGPVIVPGKAVESLLIDFIESGDMPKDRPPLSAEEQRMLRAWIDAGAVWTTATIDPAIFLLDERATQQWVQRLTVPEYIETVRSAVGVDIETDARELLPRDLRADGFSNTAYNLNIDLKHVEAYSKLARIIVERMDTAKFASQYAAKQELSEANMREVISRMGKWLLRGPLDEHEVTAFLRISDAVADQGGDFAEATGYIVEAMLQSPRFIYRIERQRGDGGQQPADGYQLASRMSYILWGGPPDAELFRAADAGDLADRGKVEAQVRRMLDDPRAIVRSKQFIHQWLNLGRLANMRPNERRYPKWDPQLAEDMREETLAFFEEVAWRRNRPLSELFNAQVTFATPKLAQHYGLKAEVRRPSKSVEKDKDADDSNGLGSPFYSYDLSSVPGRGGLLTHGSVLTIGGDEASMVTRGLFVLHDVLRGKVNDPPPCVDTTPVPTKEGLTQRGIAEQRIGNQSCGGCHARFEPLAFGLEKFDGLGSYHESDEHGNRLRDDGEILLPGDDNPVKYQTSAELMNLLADSDRVKETITWKLTQFALGRPLTAADAPILAKIHQQAQEQGGTYAAVMTALVMSDLVLKTRTQPN